MKRVMMLVLFLSALAWYPAPALAEAPDGSTGVQNDASQVPFGQIRRYLVTYINSQVVSGQSRSASVVSVTNQGTASCGISVDWQAGLSTANSCTTSLVVAPGHTVDFCSRALPGTITTCNATCSPALTVLEGKAFVASTASTTLNNCHRIGISARTYYSTSSLSDTFPAAITDANIVRVSSGNNGD